MLACSIVTAPSSAINAPPTYTSLLAVIEPRAKRIPPKQRSRLQRCRTRNLPDNITRLCVIRQQGIRITGDGEIGADLEHEESAGIALGIELQRPRQLRRRRQEVDARREHPVSEILSRQVRSGSEEDCRAESPQRVCASLCGNGIVDVDGFQ